MSRLDDIKGAYDNIQVPVELKERVLQSMERGKKGCVWRKKKNPEKRLPEKSERNQKKGHLLPFVRVAEAVAAAVAVLVISVNVSPTVANAMEQVPVLGAIVKIVNFTTYSDKQEKKADGSNGQGAGSKSHRNRWKTTDKRIKGVKCSGIRISGQNHSEVQERCGSCQ